MIRRIAISGMKGRKKDTFLLSFVVLLSFLFIVIATVFYSSSERTKNIQRTNMFGTWHASYLNGDEYIEQELKDTNNIDKLGKSRMLGKSSTFGFVGTFNEELTDMAHFQMYEGRLPENADEIAIELNQLSYFPKDVKIGDTIPVEIVISLEEKDMESAINAQMEKMEPELREIEDELKRLAGIEDGSSGFYAREDLSTDLGRIKYIRDKMGLKEDEPTHLSTLYSMWGNRVTRNEQGLEVFNGVKVVSKTSYLYASIAFDNVVIEDNIEEVRKNGTIISQSAVITRDMVVSGIVQTYSNVWDLENYPVANSFVTEEAGKLFLDEGFFKTEELDVSGYKAPINYFVKSNLTADDFYNKYENDYDNLRKNSFAYPETEGSTEATLTYGILAFIFIATIFSVFQIYLTQMKRRTRKIALLKSIGATNKQVRGILVWEVIYLLIFSIPISLLGGILIVKLILIIMNNLGRGDLNFYINYSLTILGLVVGVISVVIGMTIPMVKSMNVPLTGNITKPPKHKKSFVKDKEKIRLKSSSMKIQTFSKISLRNARFNRGNILLTLGLYTITLFVLLSSIFLSFIAFEDYIDKVIVTSKPDYGFEFDYGMRNREIPEFLSELNSINGVKGADLYKAGEHAFLWYDGIENNEVLSTFKQILPTHLMDKHFGENSVDYQNLNDKNMHLVRDAAVVNTYSVNSEDDVFNRLEQSITVGNIHKEKFNKGKEVIVLMPQFYPYENNKEISRIEDNSIIENTNKKTRIQQLLDYSKTYNINYDFRSSGYYLKDNSLSVGDKITLTVPTEGISEGDKTNDVAFHEVTVGGIINYFPEIGIWPFSGTVEAPVIIGSYNFITDLYPTTISGKGNLTAENLRYLIQSLTPTKFGKTWVYVDIDKKADEVQVQVELQRLAIEKESRLTNYIVGNDKIFNKGFRIASIIIILGASVALIALIILYNTTLSKLEQERERIGTLQAIGVTSGQFKKLYLITGILYGIISIILAHILLSFIVLATTVSNSGPFLINVKNGLWLYPWNIHIVICITFFIITVLTYYLPLGRILSKQPVENIRSLNS